MKNRPTPAREWTARGGRRGWRPLGNYDDEVRRARHERLMVPASGSWRTPVLPEPGGHAAIAQCDPVSMRAPTATTSEMGTTMRPRPAALAMDGCAPALRATRNQRIQASEPVT